MDDAERAAGIAMALGVVRALRASPVTVQAQAVGSLMSKLTPYAKPGEEGVLALLLLRVADATDAIREAAADGETPNTLADLEGFYDNKT